MERLTRQSMVIGGAGVVDREARTVMASVVGTLGELVPVEDTGLAEELVVLRHGLGRIPRGLVIVNCMTVEAPGWYRMEGEDPDWTMTEFSLRFDVDHAAVMLWVF